MKSVKPQPTVEQRHGSNGEEPCDEAAPRADGACDQGCGENQREEDISDGEVRLIIDAAQHTENASRRPANRHRADPEEQDSSPGHGDRVGDLGPTYRVSSIFSQFISSGTLRAPETVVLRSSLHRPSKRPDDDRHSPIAEIQTGNEREFESHPNWGCRGWSRRRVG